jgi:hypothetical protein
VYMCAFFWHVPSKGGENNSVKMHESGWLSLRNCPVGSWNVMYTHVYVVVKLGDPHL